MKTFSIYYKINNLKVKMHGEAHDGEGKVVSLHRPIVEGPSRELDQWVLLSLEIPWICSTRSWHVESMCKHNLTGVQGGQVSRKNGESRREMKS